MTSEVEVPTFNGGQIGLLSLSFPLLFSVASSRALKSPIMMVGYSSLHMLEVSFHCCARIASQVLVYMPQRTHGALLGWVMMPAAAWPSTLENSIVAHDGSRNTRIRPLLPLVAHKDLIGSLAK